MPPQSAPVFLTARWVHLVMLNYEVEPAVLEPLVPAGTELDTWGGKHFVSMVGFRFLDTKVLGLPIPFHRDFEEVNLRFYVRREADRELRRGVVFVKEIVPRAAIAWLARVLYNENYVAMPMSHEDGLHAEVPRMSYAWRTPGGPCRLEVHPTGAPAIPAPDSEETFITEHYWGYTRQRNGSTVEYRVEHPQWPVSQAVEAKFEGDVTPLYGSRFQPFLVARPTSAFLAEGSPVTVSRGHLIPT